MILFRQLSEKCVGAKGGGQAEARTGISLLWHRSGDTVDRAGKLVSRQEGSCVLFGRPCRRLDRPCERGENAFARFGRSVFGAATAAS